jgi:hypothetical protein
MFRGVTAAVMSGSLLGAAAIAGTAIADGATNEPRSSAPVVASYYQRMELPRHTPIRLARHHARRQVRASRSYSRAPLTGSPRMLAHALLLRQGWSNGQWQCLDSLWTRESNWHVYARNARSGAYGIPQAMPGWKMSAMGSDWRTNAMTQIRWGLSYIGRSYGSPCNALAHSNNYGYY